MKTVAIVLLSVALLAAAGQARLFTSDLAQVVRTGRTLKDYSVTLGPTNAVYDLSPYAPGVRDPQSQCFLTAGRADSVVTGPVTVIVNQGVNGSVVYQAPGSDALLVTSYSGAGIKYLTTNMGPTGFLSAQYFPTTGATAGESATVNLELVQSYSDQTVLCQLQIVFAVGGTTPPSPPPPTPSPPPAPPANTRCTSSYPSNPCGQAGSYYFNFDGSSTDVNCATPKGLSCALKTVDLSSLGAAYSQVQTGPVCECS